LRVSAMSVHPIPLNSMSIIVFVLFSRRHEMGASPGSPWTPNRFPSPSTPAPANDLAKDGDARSRYAQDPKRATSRALGNSYHSGIVGRHGKNAGAIRAQPRRPYSILAQAIDAGETDNSAFAKYAKACITLATHPSGLAAALSENAVVLLTFALHAWTGGARSQHSYTRARPEALECCQIHSDLVGCGVHAQDRSVLSSSQPAVCANHRQVADSVKSFSLHVVGHFASPIC
jgi:hypothetical protein